ncbi:MAG TPA: hypothetical protein VMA98_07160 [Candidatus Acidoferrales bacterium]|nr:hypothetical protein [Candidatus Acidoferrales bacterium]
MKRFIRSSLACLLAFTMPLGALAQHHSSGSGGSHAAPQQRPPAQQQRPPVQQRPPAQQQRPPVQQRPPAQQQRPPQPPGYSMPHDVNPPPARPVTPPSGHHVVQPPAHAVRPLPANYNGPRVGNPHHWGNWGWNHGRVWAPAPIYWGGGFWGAFAIGALTGFVLFGSLDYDNDVYYSYQVSPGTPGATLLGDYGLTQTPCGPPDLVVIWGPDNSLICAYPNNLVAPGTYDIDPTTLTLVSPPQ